MTHAEGERAIQVLLVEDAPLRRRELRELIEATAVAKVVAEAGSVAAALFLLKSSPVDAVVLNLQLWDGDGGAVLSEVKRLYPDCLAIVLSSLCGPAERERCLGLGASHLLDSPRDMDCIPGLLALRRSPVPGPAT